MALVAACGIPDTAVVMPGFCAASSMAFVLTPITTGTVSWLFNSFEHNPESLMDSFAAAMPSCVKRPILLGLRIGSM